MPLDATAARGDREEFASADEFIRACTELLPAPTAAPGDQTTWLHWIDSPLGGLIAGANPQGIVLLEFAERARLRQQLPALRRHFGGAIQAGHAALFDTLRDELDRYFAGSLQEFSVPLAYPGSDFQRQVWQALLEIPYGETRSYQQLAQQLGNPDACRAVGTSNGLNRLAILVPCHRVVNKGGTLGGYAGALWRKQKLLALERPSVFALDGSPQ